MFPLPCEDPLHSCDAPIDVLVCLFSSRLLFVYFRYLINSLKGKLPLF